MAYHRYGAVIARDLGIDHQSNVIMSVGQGRAQAGVT